LITYFLIVMVNDSIIVPSQHRHAAWYNLVLLAILGTTLIIGFNNVDKAITSALIQTDNHFKMVVIISLVIVLITTVQLFRSRKIQRIIE